MKRTMHRHLKIILICALAMAEGCSREASVENSSLGVTASADAFATRASLVESKAAFRTAYGSSGFSLKAYSGTTLKHQSDVYYNSTAGKWALQTPYDWVPGQTLDIYALAPRTVTATITPNQRKASFPYSLPADPADQKDVMLSHYSGTGNSATADLTFMHALSAVRFVKGTVECYENITVNTITLSGLYSSGTCTADCSGSVPSFSWSSLSDVSSFSVSSGVTILPSTTSLMSDSNTLMAIPQTAPAGSKIQMSITVDGVNYTIKSDLKDTEWKPGNLYKYAVNYTQGCFSISLSVHKWVMETDEKTLK